MIKYFIIASSVLLITIVVYSNFRKNYGDRIQLRISISTLNYGEFAEYIPQNGIVKRNIGISDTVAVIVEIDELYLSKIFPGLKATTTLNDHKFPLLITEVNRQVTNGRFQVVMKFNEPAPNVTIDQRLRLRIHLSEPSTELLLPMGGFFKDTGGAWVFVVGEDDRAVKREIKVGRRNSEYIEVKSGLKPDEKVITSTYESFLDRDSIDIAEIVKLYEGICCQSKR